MCYGDLFVSVCRIMDQGGLHDVCFVFVLSMYVSMFFVLFEFMRKGGVLFGNGLCSVLKQFLSNLNGLKFGMFSVRVSTILTVSGPWTCMVTILSGSFSNIDLLFTLME